LAGGYKGCGDCCESEREHGNRVSHR
jgi:hypothetical protein